MKKIFSFIIAILVILPCAFSFVGCFNINDGGEDEFDGATSISVVQLQEIKLDEGYKFKFKNFYYKTENVVEGLTEIMTMKLVDTGSGIQAEGFYSYPETETSDAQTATFYIFGGRMYVYRDETVAVKTTSDTCCYGKFSCGYNIADASTINSLSGFAKKLATLVNKIYSNHIDSSIIMNNYTVEGDTHKRFKVTSDNILKLKLTSEQEFVSTSLTKTTETRLYYSSKNVYRIYSSVTDVYAEVNMPVITNTYKYLVQSYNGQINTDIPTGEYLAI